jgi:hypothetical protein
MVKEYHAYFVFVKKIGKFDDVLKMFSKKETLATAKASH